ncbi:MAG TPA: S8 family serine peptidase [Solirubrobacteraceae bacterium]|nr:S8 family serine peptidase [Solirubrobacteraceae bacterium]
MSRIPRGRAALLGAVAVGATAIAGAGTAAGSTARSNAARPDLAHLSSGQIHARVSGKQEAVIVVFDNQLTNLPANRAHRRARAATATSIQAPLIAQLKQVGATHVTGLSLLNAVAATMPSAEVQALRHTAGIKEVVPDGTITLSDPTDTTPTVAPSRVQAPAVAPATATDGQQMCSANPNQPMLEPEELTSIHDASDDPSDGPEADSVATGTGVIIGNVDADSLAGNPNMIRPDGSHVIIDAPNPNKNVYNDEFNGDVSTMGAQGTVTYSYGSQLPYSNIPPTCTFTIQGDATGASILTTGYFTDTNSQGQVVAPESQVIAGLQQAVSEGVNVVSESYGYGALPGANDDLLEPTNQAMVKAGVVVVESAGDSGSSGTVEAPADNPDIIDVGGTTDLRLLAQADGYTNGWLDDNMTTLSSGGTAPNGRVVDLVAPGFLGLAAAGEGGDPDLPTEAFGGTSQSAPFVSGAAADVIQAYRDTHNGTTPSPAKVKRILTSTATDIGAPSDQQGAGLLNVYAAVEAARQMPGATKSATSGSNAPELVDQPTQIDVEGTGGSTIQKSVSLFNASSSPETVTGTYRVLGSETPFGNPVTENVSAPAASAPIPAQGATAAAPIEFTVPAGTDVLDADMIWPDPTNNDNNILTILLTDPSGKLAQQSYDYGASEYVPCVNGGGCSPDIQHTTVQHPMAGTWTAQILWSNGRGHVQNAPDVPGPYTGTVTFQASGQNFTTSPASAPVTIPAHHKVSVPLNIAMPEAPGDSPESVQFASSDGLLQSSVPIARRTLIPSAGGSFTATLTSSVSRGPGQIQTFYVDVPKGQSDLDVSFNAPDHAADDPVYYYLFSPKNLRPGPVKSGLVSFTSTDTTPTSGNASGNASLVATHPQAGLWEIDVMQGATTDGTVFSQAVTGTVAYNQLDPFSETGLPKSTSKKIASGASVPISVRVTNTMNHTGLFELQPTGDDITGGNTTTPEAIGPGATGTLTATLSPTAAAGSKVHGVISVVESTDFTATEPAIGFPGSIADWHDFAYEYTVK